MLEQLDSLGNKTHIIESKRLSHVYWYTRMFIMFIAET